MKGDNVLVREADGEPVLVDFGAGTMPGVPRVTRGSLAPANLRYRVGRLQQLPQERQPLRRPSLQDVDDAAQLRVLTGPRRRSWCRRLGSLGTQGQQYPACYDGKAPWNTVGPNLPYTDN